MSAFSSHNRGTSLQPLHLMGSQKTDMFPSLETTVEDLCSVARVFLAWFC